MTRTGPKHATVRGSLALPVVAVLVLSVSVPAAPPPEGRLQRIEPPVAEQSAGLLDSAAVHYNAGNAAYRAGRYAQAAAAYERSVAAGGRNSAVYYNLGNACFRLGQVGRAILSYERSLQLDPRNEDARQNLEFASLLTADRVEDETMEIRVQQGIKRALALLAPEWLALSLSVGFLVLCLIGAWWILGGRRGALTITVFVLSACVFVGGTGAAAVQRWMSSQANEAIVLADEVEARFEPSTGAKVAFVLHEGTKVWVERREADWALVHIASGLRGWLPHDSFTNI